MIKERPPDFIVFVVVLIFLVLTAVGFLRKLKLSYSILSVYIQKAIEAAREAYRTWLQGRHLDEVQLIVQERVQALQVEHFLWVCHILSGLLVPGSIVLLSDLWKGGEQLFSVTQTMAFLCLQVPLTLLVFSPCVLSWRTIDMFYLYLIVCAAVYASPWAIQPNDVALTMLFCLNAPLGLLNIARRSLRINILMNLILAASSCSTIMLHGAAITSMPAFACVVQCMSLSVFPICACKVHSSIVKAIRHGLECDAAKEALAAACAMLRSCCDVVVELDSKGTILSKANDLGSFLLRGPSCNLQNTMLVDLVSHETDKELFANKLMAERPSDMALAEATHVRMRDGNDNTIRVELLWFRFLRLDEAHFMLGLREFSDVISAKPPARSCGGPAPLADDSSSQRQSDCSSCSFGSSESSGGSFCEPPAVLGVDSACAGLHLRECTIGFSHRVGRVPLGSCLLELVHHKREFKNWVEDSVNMALNDEDSEPMAVTLQMRSGQVKAMCRVLRPSQNWSRENPEEEEHFSVQSHFDPEHVRLHFYEIKHFSGHKRVRRGHGEGKDLRWLSKGTPVRCLSL